MLCIQAYIGGPKAKQVLPADEDSVVVGSFVVEDDDDEEDSNGPGVFGRLEKIAYAPKRRPSQRLSFIERNKFLVGS